MISIYEFIFFSAGALFSLAASVAASRKYALRSRLNFFLGHTASEAESNVRGWSQCGSECGSEYGSESAALLDNFGDRLGIAGFVEQRSRSRFKQGALLFTAIVTTSVFLSMLCAGAGAMKVAVALIASLYLCAAAATLFLNVRAKSYERELLFQTPIFLEALILLVESGLGILPALDRIVGDSASESSETSLKKLYRIVYQLSANGMPFSQALEIVADASPHRIVRHTMLHLDVTGSEGGELIPALRALSDHAHTEWKLSVEQRVRRLENFVVFPVFASVIGLMLLTAAVPIAPLLDLRETLNQRPKAGLSELAPPNFEKGEP